MLWHDSGATGLLLFFGCVSENSKLNTYLKKEEDKVVENDLKTTIAKRAYIQKSL